MAKMHFQFNKHGQTIFGHKSSCRCVVAASTEHRAPKAVSINRPCCCHAPFRGVFFAEAQLQLLSGWALMSIYIFHLLLRRRQCKHAAAQRLEDTLYCKLLYLLIFPFFISISTWVFHLAWLPLRGSHAGYAPPRQLAKLEAFLKYFSVRLMAFLCRRLASTFTLSTPHLLVNFSSLIEQQLRAIET